MNNPADKPIKRLPGSSRLPEEPPFFDDRIRGKGYYRIICPGWTGNNIDLAESTRAPREIEPGDDFDQG